MPGSWTGRIKSLVLGGRQCCALLLEEGMATTPVFLSEESLGQKSLMGCSPWGPTESEVTKHLRTQAAPGKAFLILRRRVWAMSKVFPASPMGQESIQHCMVSPRVSPVSSCGQQRFVSANVHIWKSWEVEAGSTGCRNVCASPTNQVEQVPWLREGRF